jgi:hypothetical protein
MAFQLETVLAVADLVRPTPAGCPANSGPKQGSGNGERLDDLLLSG